MAEKGMNSAEILAVRPGHRVRISFDVPSPSGADLIIEHRRRKQLLAYENRPLDAGVDNLEVKSHPDASHMACRLRAGTIPIDGVRFNIDCGERIEPVGRHFIVIGAMKAGTTTLFELLARHSALCQTWAQLPDLSFTKEINYFNRLYKNNDTPLHYDWRFPFDPDKHAWTLDVSPGYAKWPASKSVPARIASLGRETKLVYILREPIDRIESHLAHTLQFGGEINNLQHCIRTSCYALQLDRYVEHTPREDILLLEFEQLRQDPDAVLKQVCDFLSIEPITGHNEVHNRRRVTFHLDAKQRAEYAAKVRPDLRRLINVYGFKPAETWLNAIGSS